MAAFPMDWLSNGFIRRLKVVFGLRHESLIYWLRAAETLEIGSR